MSSRLKIQKYLWQLYVSIGHLIIWHLHNSLSRIMFKLIVKTMQQIKPSLINQRTKWLRSTRKEAYFITSLLIVSST